MPRAIESVPFEPMPLVHADALKEAGFEAVGGYAYICRPVAGDDLTVRFGHQDGVYIVHVLGEPPVPTPWRYIVSRDFDKVLTDAVIAMGYYRAEMQ